MKKIAVLVLLATLTSLPSEAAERAVVYAIADRGGEGIPAGIWVMASDGSSPRQLTSATEDYEPSWSPDRSKIAFLRYGVTEPAPGVERYSTYLWTMDADGSNQMSIAETDDFDWSPDGDRVVFAEGVD